MSHTLGPWKQWRGQMLNDGTQVVNVGDENGWPTALVFGNMDCDNARLIAAAPELYEACLAAKRYDASIAGRATRGEVDLREAGGGIASGDDLDALYFDWQKKATTAIAKVEGTA